MHSIYEHHRKVWGLLAKALVHSTLMQADPPYSRASPLPQGICGGQGNRTYPCGTPQLPSLLQLAPCLRYVRAFCSPIESR
ncbi:hypothetical protein FHK92_17610 [Pseudomonas brassicacearum subsp. neoaurantiaca]|uniref:Uncharacterized protein n=1 Tax=Pseudomonas brassicacearum subsp. neoaurantiaca TaxID=494916 RepID=A0A7V8UDK6_9PSED|nr:hypothetical protein [Pseudomonas brassicacearum subsp. neoaurantiaca]